MDAVICGEPKAKILECPGVDEGRKRVILIAASILAARKLAQYDGGKRVPATVGRYRGCCGDGRKR
jgi:hypothetical protein